MRSNGVANSLQDCEHKHGGVCEIEIKDLSADSSSVEFLKVEGDQALDTQLDVGSSAGVVAYRKGNLHQSVTEISRLKESDGTASPRGAKYVLTMICCLISHASFDLEMLIQNNCNLGLEHCPTAPIGAHRSFSLDSQEVIFSRSKTEKKETPRHDLKLDRLSERERKKLIVNLVKIQNDGTVEVDIEKSAPVASELLELQSVERTPRHLNDVINGFNRSVPRLKIAILVVGTRGDVQPFLAVAKQLQACQIQDQNSKRCNKVQEFGHQVRLATHANFKTFVTSAGVNFYPLGGDPRVLAGSFIQSCFRGACFMLQKRMLFALVFENVAIVDEVSDEPVIHDFSATICMTFEPTYEFPHPLARVPQSAGYWLSYVVVDLLIWWGIRGYINDFRKKKLKLPPIAYFSTYHGSISHLPTGYMWSSHLVPKPKGLKKLSIEIFRLELFVNSFTLRLAFGYPLEDPKKTTGIILKALRSTGQRGIIDRGWGDLGIPEVPDNIFLLEDCPHDWLFPQCSAVVKTRAIELAKLIENENGVAAAVDAFHRHLPPELPLPIASSDDDESPNPVQWFFQQIAKWCCLPCGGL
ncbi:hypothetical protein RJ641_031777 [Dillenia turbinata]|uniref:Glycosyltransferase family 28 N-terminal domain-containing protein n=1 Tax=Dillenia turbinata TaxID=194707 RepID=A0AAN8VV09_9MAGN